MEIAKTKPKMTIIEAAEECALGEISKLASRCCLGQVVVDLWCANVQDVQNEIAAEKPWTMSWSNLVDYFCYEEFHEMARKCSQHGDTIHFGYSMNWVQNVQGTFLIDYAGASHSKLRGELIDASYQAMKEAYQSFAWEKRIRLPLPHNPMNGVGTLLLIQHYNSWSQYFFEKARKDGKPCQVACVEWTAWETSPLSHTGSRTISFTWTYDPDITFRAKT
jgi:hypothetical protein